MRNDIPVYATQGGGLATFVRDTLIFIESPEAFPEMLVGSEVPKEWDFQPINSLAKDSAFNENFDL